MKLILKERKPKEEATPIKLDIDIRYDEMLKDIITKLNDYRGPENQIVGIYNEFNQKIPLTYRLRSDLTLYFECDLETPNP